MNRILCLFVAGIIVLSFDHLYGQCSQVLNATINACDANNEYSVSGDVSYIGNPGTGQLIVEVDNGITTYTQVFNPPFVDNQLYAFTIPGIPGDASPTTLTAYFTNDPACSNGIAYTAPQCVSCLVDYLFGNIGPCESDYTYTVEGQVSFIDSPSTGTFIVEVDNGATTYSQVFNPPFIDGQVYNYSISGIPTTGEPSQLSAYFSDNPTCVNSIAPYTAPDCSCIAEIGTFAIATSGATSNTQVLCFGDTLRIIPNGDVTYPEDINDAVYPYDPDIIWLLYSCPPTVATSPSTIDDIEDDPCLVTQVGGNLSYAFIDSVYDWNDLYYINQYPGAFTDNIIYFVPLTSYSMSGGQYSVTNTTDLPCYSMGQPFSVQYLPEVTETTTENCAAETVTTTISGGLPELDGSLFTVVPGSLVPSTANFVNTSCANGGSIVVGNVNINESYSFEIEDGNGCPVAISGTMNGTGTAMLTYPQTSYCADAADPSPTMVGTAGGVYSSTAGISLNASTGVVDLSASTAGTYTITYTAPGTPCPATSAFTITINALPVVSAGTDQFICQGNQATLSGSGTVGTTYSWNNGVTNNVAFTPSVTQTYTVTGTSAAGCQASGQVLVTIVVPPAPLFVANVTNGCSPVTVTFTNQSGGVNCSWNFGDGTTASGCGSVTHTYVNIGCYDIVLTTELTAGCSGTSSQANLVCVTPYPEAAFTPVPNILTTLDATSQMVNSSVNAVSYTWNFGDGGTSLLENPVHTFPADSPGSYEIMLIAYNSIGCRDTAYAVVVVNEELIFYVPNTFTPDGDEFNQSFRPVFTSGFDPFDFNLLIFNRWGEIIFESNDAVAGWDGTYDGQIVQEGTYTWKIEFKTLKNDSREYSVGHVNVLR